MRRPFAPVPLADPASESVARRRGWSGAAHVWLVLSVTVALTVSGLSGMPFLSGSTASASVSVGTLTLKVLTPHADYQNQALLQADYEGGQATVGVYSSVVGSGVWSQVGTCYYLTGSCTVVTYLDYFDHTPRVYRAAAYNGYPYGGAPSTPPPPSGEQYGLQAQSGTTGEVVPFQYRPQVRRVGDAFVAAVDGGKISNLYIQVYQELPDGTHREIAECQGKATCASAGQPQPVLGRVRAFVTTLNSYVTGYTYPPGASIADSGDIPTGLAGPVGPLEVGAAGLTAPTGLKKADPVESSTGEVVAVRTDAAVASRGPGMTVVSQYRSSAHDKAGSFGLGWSAAWDARVEADPVVADGAQVTQEDGSQVEFAPNGTGGYTAPARTTNSLTGNSTSGWTMTRRAGTVLTFAPDGRITRIADRNGEGTDYRRNPDGTVASASCAAGTITFATDPLGHVTSATTPSGRSWAYAYTGDQLAAVTDQAGLVTRYGYDATSRLTSRTLPSGGVFTYTYDTSGRAVAQTNADGGTTTLGYGWNTTNDVVTTVTDPLGRVTTDSWDDNLLLTAETTAAGTPLAATTTYGHDPATLGVTSTTDPLGRTSTAAYNPQGDMVRATDPLGRASTWTRNAVGDPTSTAGPDGVRTDIAYDSHRNPVTVTVAAGTPLAATTTLRRTDTSHPGDVTGTTDPTGRTASRSYDSHGLPIRSTVGTLTTTFGYDPDGLVVSQVHPGGQPPNSAAGHTTTWTRDTAGRVTAVTDQDGGTSRTAYDTAGRVASTTDPVGRTVGYAHDLMNRITAVTTGTGPPATTITTAFDKDGEITNQTDGAGKTTAHSYDPAGNLAATTDPNGRTTRYGYDLARQRTSLTAADGSVTRYTHNDAGQPTGTSHGNAGTPDVTIGYDPAGRRSTMTDGTGTTTWSYDQAGRAATVASPVGTVGYQYDLAGRTTGIVYPGSKTVTRAYDPNGNWASTTDWAGRTTTFATNADGAYTTTKTPEGVIDQVALTGEGRPTQAVVLGGSASTTPLATYTATYDKSGKTVTVGGATGHTYGYDDQSRLATVDATTPNVTWDQAGNLTRTPAVPAMTYDPARQLTTITPSASATSTAVTFDPRGNRTTQGATAYAYNQDNLLTGTTGPAANATYAYSGDALRATATTTSIPAHGKATTMTSAFLWDRNADAGLPLLLADGQNTYVYGPGGQPVEQADTHDVPTYLHTDTGGSVRLLTDSRGRAAGTYEYDAFGAVTAHTGKATSPLQYRGQYTDPTGLIYLHARYYDPSSGQFLTQDPLVSQTRDPYGYAGNDPLDALDPTGLSWYNPTTWSEKTLVATGGIALGVAAAAAGVGTLIVAGPAVIGGFAVVSVVLGAAAAVTDDGPCRHDHDAAACVGLGLGLTGAGLGIAAVAGVVGVALNVIKDESLAKSVLDGIGAFGFQSGLAGTAVDVGAAFGSGVCPV